MFISCKGIVDKFFTFDFVNNQLQLTNSAIPFILLPWNVTDDC